MDTDGRGWGSGAGQLRWPDPQADPESPPSRSPDPCSRSATKSRSGWGYVNLASMLLAVLVIALRPVAPDSIQLGDSVVQLTLASAFHQINYVINSWFGAMNDKQVNLASPAFIKVQSFIAFA